MLRTLNKANALLEQASAPRLAIILLSMFSVCRGMKGPGWVYGGWPQPGGGAWGDARRPALAIQPQNIKRQTINPGKPATPNPTPRPSGPEGPRRLPRDKAARVPSVGARGGFGV